MIHFDGSGSDAGAVAWFADPRCRVSYQLLVLDDGSFVRIAPDTARAWHAGVCRPSSERLGYHDANSAFYGVSVATNGRVGATALQLLTTAWLCRRYFEAHGWPVTDTWRIVGHEDEAWPRGRKSDPSGPIEHNPILDLEDIHSLLGRIVI
jgi:N-acetyl-anhydromuramyl-L-alanine amidase AmpD